MASATIASATASAATSTGTSGSATAASATASATIASATASSATASAASAVARISATASSTAAASSDDSPSTADGRCFWPSITPSAMTRAIRSFERMASSLPGIARSTSSGSQFVSTRPISGMWRRLASRTASCSALRSITKIALGSFCMFATPDRFVSSLSSSCRRTRRSLAGSSSSWPSASRRRRSWSRLMRSVIVRKLVSRPPSQRWFTYGMPERSAWVLIASRACFFVPTKRTVPPLAAMSRTISCASLARTTVFCRSIT